MQVLSLVRNNIRVLFRSRASLAAIVLGPFLLILIAGIAFERAEVAQIKVGVAGETDKASVEHFFERLQDQGVRLFEYRDLDNCLDRLKYQYLEACMDFELIPEEKLTIYLDYSRLASAEQTLGLLSSQIALTTGDISENTTQDLIDRLNLVKQEVAKSRPVIVSLTTDNERSIRGVDQMIAKLSALRLQTENVDTSELSFEERSFLSWLETINRVAQSMNGEYKDIKQNVLAELDDSAIAETNKNNIILLLGEGGDALEELADSLANKQLVSQKDLEDLLELVNQTADKVGAVEVELSSLKGFKTTSLDELTGMKHALNRNLVKYIQIQNSLNQIDSAVSDAALGKAAVVTPFPTTVQGITTTTSRFQWIFPTLMVVIFMLTGLLLSSLLLVNDRQSQAHIRTYMAKVSKPVLLLSIITTTLTLMAGQLLAVILIALIFIGASFFFILPKFLVGMLLIIGLFSLMGIAIGATSRSESNAIFACIFLAAAMIFFSDMFIPSTVSWIQSVQAFNPLLISTNLLKRMLFFQQADILFRNYLLNLMLWVAVLLGIVAFVYNPQWKRKLRFWRGFK